MARIRSIHPGIYTDEAWASVSIAARWFAKGLCTEADDNGVFEWKPLGLKMKIFPADAVDVPALLAELDQAGIVMRFDVGGKPHGVIRNFCKYQRPRKPKAWFPVTDEAKAFAAVGCDGAVGDDVEGGAVPQKSELDALKAVPVPPKSEKSPQREDEGGRREKKIDEPTVHCRPKADPLPVQEAFDNWNATAIRRRLPIAKTLTAHRRKQIKARLADAGLTGWREALSAVEASPLCLGENERGWRADLDFVLQPKSFAKLREGSYAPAAKPGQSQPRALAEMSPELIAARRALLEQAPEQPNA